MGELESRPVPMAKAESPAGPRPTRNKTPAVLICETAGDLPAIASLTTLDRLLVAAFRAGCEPIYVACPGPLPPLRRAPALGIPFFVGPDGPSANGPAFVASTRVLLTTGDVQRLIDGRSRLVVDGQPAPAGFTPNFSGKIERDLAGQPEMPATGVAAVIADGTSGRAATRELWASLTSSSDGVVDRHFNRPVGRLLSKLLIHTPVTPNQISIAATLLGILAAVGFGSGSHSAAIIAAIVLQLSAILDCVDGDVARVVFKESPLGKWLDIVGDQIVHIGVFVGIGIGLWRAETSGPVLALAVSAGAGVVISFAVVARGLLNPRLQKNTALQRLIDATTNRDFSVLLLGLAFIDRLVWFLWLAAFGVHVFWILAFSLQFSRRPQVAA